MSARPALTVAIEYSVDCLGEASFTGFFRSFWIQLTRRKDARLLGSCQPTHLIAALYALEFFAASM